MFVILPKIFTEGEKVEMWKEPLLIHAPVFLNAYMNVKEWVVLLNEEAHVKLADFFIYFFAGSDWWLVADSDELQSLAELEVSWVVFGSVWRWMGLNDKSDSETSLLCCMHVEIVTISSETMSKSKN